MSPLMKVGLRWKAPDGEVSTELEHTVGSDARSLASSSDDFRLAAAAAQFGMLLRNSGSRGDASWASTIALIEDVAREKGVAIQLSKVQEMRQIASFGIMSTPGVVIDGKVVHAGGIPARSKVEEWLSA